MTPHRTIRVPDDKWEPFVAKAKAEGTDASSKIREFIHRDLHGVDYERLTSDLAQAMSAASALVISRDSDNE